MAPKYNEEIYVEIDRKFNCAFIIGEQKENIKEMNLSLLTNYYMPEHKSFGSRFAYEKGAFRKLISKDFDVYITTMEPYNFTLWALKLYCLLKRKPIYYWTHGWYGKESFLKRVIKRIDYSTTSGFFLYGNYARNLMIKEGFNPDKLYVIHNSLNYSKQYEIRKMLQPTNVYEKHFGNNYHTIIFIGRLTKVKRLDLLVKAMVQLRDQGQKYNLVLVGDGTERSVLEGMVELNGLKDSVWFYGACYDEKTNAELIYNADVCVSPGNVGLTAMHCLMFGCPVITHNNFAMQMPEFESINDGITGSFFKENDIDSLAGTIMNWFVCKGNQREEVRIACYKEIDDNWTPDFEMNVLEKVLKRYDNNK